MCYKKENQYKLRGPNLVITSAKCWVKDFISPHKYHALSQPSCSIHTLRCLACVGSSTKSSSSINCSKYIFCFVFCYSNVNENEPFM